MAGFLARLLVKLRRYDSVVDDYREAAQQAPDSAMAYVNWGIRLSQQAQQGQQTRQSQAVIDKNLAQAMAKFQTAARMDPSRADIYTNWGIALARAGKLDTAIAKINQALLLDPTNPDIYGLMGAALVEAGRLEEASHTYAQAMEIAPKNETLLVNWGIALARYGDYAGAKKRFEQALAIRRAQPWVTFLWGVVLAEEGDYQAAIEKFKQTIRFRPKHGEAMLFWCLCLNRLGKYDDAIEVARDGLAVMDDSADLYLALAEALLHASNAKQDEGLLDNALANARHALMLDDINPDVHELMGQIDSRRGEHASARQRFEKALACLPPTPQQENAHPPTHHPVIHHRSRLLASLGEAYLADGDTCQALTVLTQATELTPDNTDIVLLWASVVFQQSEELDNSQHHSVSDAIGRLFELASEHTQSTQLSFLLGNIYLERGDYTNAIECLEKVMASQPTHRDAGIQLGLAYCGSHQTAEAVRCVRALSRHYPDNARVQFYYGHMLYRHGQWRQASQKYAAVLAFDSTMIEARIGQAEAELMLGNANVTLDLLSPLLEHGNPGQAVQLLSEWATLAQWLATHDGKQRPELLSQPSSPLVKAIADTIEHQQALEAELSNPAYLWALQQCVAKGVLPKHRVSLTHDVPDIETMGYQHPLLVAVLG